MAVLSKLTKTSFRSLNDEIAEEFERSIGGLRRRMEEGISCEELYQMYVDYHSNVAIPNRISDGVLLKHEPVTLKRRKTIPIRARVVVMPKGRRMDELGYGLDAMAAALKQAKLWNHKPENINPAIFDRSEPGTPVSLKVVALRVFQDPKNLDISTKLKYYRARFSSRSLMSSELVASRLLMMKRFMNPQPANEKTLKLSSSVNKNKKKNRKQRKSSKAETLVEQMQNLKLKEANTSQKQKQENNGREKRTVPSCSTTQKVSANCEKCARTSKRCNDVTSNLKTAKNEIKDLKKKLADYEGPEEQQNERKTWFELEKELREEKQKNEEMRVFSSIIDELSECIAEKDNAIRILKANVPADALKQIAETQNLSLEMRKIFWDLRGKLDNLLLEDPLAKAEQIVNSLKQHCNDPEIVGQAAHEFLAFRGELTAYEIAIEKEIKKIQTDPFLTQLELEKIPELPVISEWLQKARETAQAEWNRKIDLECVVCYRDEGTEWFQCSGCPKRTHLQCASRWWQSQQRNLQPEACPHCKKVLENKK